jgi:hypothetical protein
MLCHLDVSFVFNVFPQKQLFPYAIMTDSSCHFGTLFAIYMLISIGSVNMPFLSCRT